MAITREKILSAFQPAKEISDPKRFAGRKDQLEKGAELLLAKEHIFIYGARGIGKSSLAKQLEIIASGNVELLRNIESEFGDEDFNYATCYLTRDESVNNINQLLYRLMVDSSALGKFTSLVTKFGEPGIYNLGTNLDAKLVSDFWVRAKAVASTAINGLAIFVDEFELIANHEGFSSLLKACPPGVIFVITGIATTERELVRDHKSIDRQLTTGKLPVEKMRDDELVTVIDTAERVIQHEITYASATKNELIRLVCGQPYLLHLIGRASLWSAFKNKKVIVDVEDLQNSLAEVVLKKTDSGLEERYLRAIGHSPQRESVLRILAQHCAPTAHTRVLYPLTEAEGVTNPSYWVADLQKKDSGQEVRKVKEQFYAFSDPLFQAYVVATPRRLPKDKESAEDSGNTTKTRVECVSIIHLSDLHFGDGHYFSEIPMTRDSIPDADKLDFAKTIVSTIQSEKMVVDLLAVSGDITQRALSTEFNLAKSALSRILDCTSSTNETELLVVPGNHDVNWALQAGDPGSGFIGFHPYVQFRNSLIRRQSLGSAIDPERLYEVCTLKREGINVAVVLFNSAVLIKKEDDRGYIGPSQLTNAMHELADICSEGIWIKVAMFHHHIVPVASIEAKLESEALLSDAAQVKKKLLDLGFSLVLHGHRHHGHEETVGDGKNSMVVVGCGSSAVSVKERGSQPLQFNNIVLNPRGTDLQISVVRYTFDTGCGEWKRGVPKTFAFTGRML